MTLVRAAVYLLVRRRLTLGGEMMEYFPLTTDLLYQLRLGHDFCFLSLKRTELIYDGAAELASFHKENAHPASHQHWDTRAMIGCSSELDAIEEHIYEAVSGALDWNSVLREIAHTADGAAALLLSERSVFCGSVSDAPSVEHWIQAAKSASWAQRANILASIHEMSMTTLENLSFPHSMVAGNCHVAASKIGNGCAIVVLRPLISPFEERSLCSINRLLPHLERAVRLVDAFSLARARQVLDALTALGLPTLVLDEQGCSIMGNDLLRPLYPGVLRADENRLVIGDPKSDMLIRRIFAETTREPLGVRSIALSARQIKARYLLHFVPISQEVAFLKRSARWVLVVTSPRNLPVPRRSVLAAVFDLTPTEAKVAQLLARSQSTDEIAESLKIGRETVRTHIKSIFEKTGVRRHTDFIRVVSSLHSLPLLGARTHL